MNTAALRLLGLLVFMSVTGCAPKSPAPVAPERDPAIERREQWFGERAFDADIQWRSSGLGVRIAVPGDGGSPRMGDTIRVHYTGRLKDGTVFDDSRSRGKPADLPMSQLIAGWAAAMSALKPGGHADIFIPPSLGYGARKVANVPANSGLIFEVELIAVNPSTSQP